ncbi:hypothetical protein [Thermococcus sp.]|uniref:hypothetical protein n=1 Tax=Thermococcus sp. TaxID=35749 RepID=UPI002638C851|nr:hypothetical protein [Thermococcus sp.]
MSLKLGLKPVDRVLGGVEERSLILIHEADPRSLGKFLALHVMKEKLDSDNLVGYFNIGMPLSVFLSVTRRFGIDVERHLKEGRLMIVDTFGSIYDLRVEMENVWYLSGPISLEILNEKYIEVIRTHKEKWKQLNRFEGRELWGVTVSISDYLHMFGAQKTQRYLELADLLRTNSDVYRKYPAGTNVWVYTGNDLVVLPLLYRKATYVLRTESTVTEEGKVIRTMKIVKAPGLKSMPAYEYTFRSGRLKFP